MAGPDTGSESGLRRGLPRTPGGEPWPPPGVVPARAVDTPGAGVHEQPSPSAPAEAAPAAAVPSTPRRETAGAAVPGPQNGASESDAGARASGTVLRRGLPRVAGGEPWPTVEGALATSVEGALATSAESVAAPSPGVPKRQTAGAPALDPRNDASDVDAAAPAPASDAPLRRGLPRAAGGEPWPPEGTADASAEPAEAAARRQDVGAPVPDPRIGASEPTVAPEAAPEPDAAPAARVKAPARGDVVRPDGEVRLPLTVPRTVWAGRAAYHRPAPAPEPRRIGPFTRAQWMGAIVVGGGGLLFAAAMAVLFARFLLSLDALRDFLTTYPGEYHLPAGAPVGIPAWLGWQHFFNVFLMVLIIRTGLTVRREKRPAVFWTPRRNKKGKTSLTIWFHQALDLLWIVNGLVFVVLLFVTGQWMRIVPTSWEVFPNALSAALQYVSLDWPTENGWVNYNALQQLAYFSTVFVAAPLAIASGFRMSGLWPKKNARLSAAIPIDWARRVHFPTMLFFVVFIVIHVVLVLATGALRNLNHMYAAQGSTDPTAYADNWTGFWLFALSLAVIAAAWIAARPMVIAPVARLFGTVSSR
ncbi:cytochrome b/b6 domain-containing protein [Microbacterium dextranolyticum]|uniref:Cytochrome b561 bacterial/Ni-hydrogenase domain-containing protein n=1 Tax=Microbacterium dextranolyticum TaxID=36806 RepID=A0A9W6HL45_9MICO|nr:cytochrome b/b6 domain-containing protein [Microbacterium dextranolyticum]MBM7464188.1 thiosulfate reductase cytochrome b subunit [Microbacterium dextranolyticum]GLJ95182.1 hypothetical protein GCM10017591_12440 [Microbacterium dextranolyticum]